MDLACTSIVSVKAILTLRDVNDEHAGIETVRRDNCLLVKNLVNECLFKILIDRDIPGAIQYVKNTVSDLLMNRMDLSLLVITKVGCISLDTVLV